MFPSLVFTYKLTDRSPATIHFNSVTKRRNRNVIELQFDVRGKMDYYIPRFF